MRPHPAKGGVTIHALQRVFRVLRVSPAFTRPVEICPSERFDFQIAMGSVNAETARKSSETTLHCNVPV